MSAGVEPRVRTAQEGLIGTDEQMAFGPNVLIAEHSAKAVLSDDQWVWAVAAVVLTALAVTWSPAGTAAVFAGVANLGFVILALFKTITSLVGVPDVATETSDEPVDDPPLWPRVTVLCPMAKEGDVAKQLVRVMDEIDYPKDRIQVLLLIDADDEETQASLPDVLPLNQTLIKVPIVYPRCKPRVCNYALWMATGEYLVIFDAEDRVDPSQVKNAIRVFLADKKYRDGRLACVQGRLRFDNDDVGILPAFFAIEYDQWHGLLVPGLARLKLPLPLGGTSNYFRRDVLDQLGGWDAYNVTEDADLGLRLFAHGWRTASIPDTTWEHAVTEVGAWVKQRSRWTKGYFMTALLNLRHPVKLVRSMGLWNALAAIGLVGILPILMAVAPVLWILFAVTEIFDPAWMDLVFPGPLHTLAWASLIVGLIQSVLMALVAVRHRRSLKLVVLSVFFPLYGMLSSIAAVLALYELFVKPHAWRKTTHKAAAVSTGSVAAPSAAAA